MKALLTLKCSIHYELSYKVIKKWESTSLLMLWLSWFSFHVSTFAWTCLVFFVDGFSSLFIYIHTQRVFWILGHRLGFYCVSKILVEKQFMNARHSMFMKKLRSSTCCEKCYTFWTLHWKLKNQILLCFIAQDKQFVSLQKKTLDEMCKQN